MPDLGACRKCTVRTRERERKRDVWITASATAGISPTIIQYRCPRGRVSRVGPGGHAVNNRGNGHSITGGQIPPARMFSA